MGFPPALQEAIDNGVLSEEDAGPENVKAIHDEHAREGLAVLHDLDAVLDARRRGVDPRNNKKPMLHEAKERLDKFFAKEPARLEQWWETLMATYGEAFGTEAAEAFGKAIRAWHAGVTVVATADRVAAPVESPVVQDALVVAQEPRDVTEKEPETPPTDHQRRSRANREVSRLPVPKPLPEAVKRGHFGIDEQQRPIHPDADEVRAITENHAEKIVDLMGGLREIETWLSNSQCSDRARLYREREDVLGKVQLAIAKYAEDFGPEAGERLEAYARREEKLRNAPASDRGYHR